MEEYLTINELSGRIKMAPGTIRNLIWKKQFQENVHYLKPTPRKVLFIWKAVEDWLHGKSVGDNTRIAIKTNSLINIWMDVERLKLSVETFLESLEMEHILKI